jgi:hypothetical protein
MMKNNLIASLLGVLIMLSSAVVGSHINNCKGYAGKLRVQVPKHCCKMLGRTDGNCKMEIPKIINATTTLEIKTNVTSPVLKTVP